MRKILKKVFIVLFLALCIVLISCDDNSEVGIYSANVKNNEDITITGTYYWKKDNGYLVISDGISVFVEGDTLGYQYGDVLEINGKKIIDNSAIYLKEIDKKVIKTIPYPLDNIEYTHFEFDKTSEINNSMGEILSVEGVVKYENEKFYLNPIDKDINIDYSLILLPKSSIEEETLLSSVDKNVALGGFCVGRSIDTLYFITTAPASRIYDDALTLMSDDEIENYDKDIEIAIGMNEYLSDGMEDIINDFQNLYNNKVKITINNYKLLDKSTIQLYTRKDNINLYTNSNLVNLSPFIESEKEYLEMFKEDYLHDIDNDLYSLPIAKTYDVLLYNKEIFERLNYTVPDTYEELEALATTVFNDIENGKLVVNDYFYPLVFRDADNAFYNIIMQNNSELSRVDGSYIISNRDNAIKAMQDIQDLSKKNIVSLLKDNDIVESFASNKCLMMVVNSGDVNDDMLNALGVAPIISENGFILEQGLYAAISYESSNIERAIAYRFIKYLTTKEVNAKICNENKGYMSVRNSSKELIDKNSLYDVMNDYNNSDYTLFTYDDKMQYYESSDGRLTEIFEKIIINKEDVNEVFNHKTRGLN